VAGLGGHANLRGGRHHGGPGVGRREASSQDDVTKDGAAHRSCVRVKFEALLCAVEQPNLRGSDLGRAGEGEVSLGSRRIFSSVTTTVYTGVETQNRGGPRR